MSKLLSRLSTGRGKYQRPDYVDDHLQRKTPRARNHIFPPKENGLSGFPVVRRPKLAWNPLVLTNVGLLSFGLAFLACLVALGLLWYFCNENDGLDLLTSNPYTWTYGPTAVLIVLISLWRQLDYHCKILTPWEELYKGSAPASKSILLDYSSAFQVTTFGRAVGNAHVAILLTILGFVTLKVITIASTGLLFATTIRRSPQSVDLVGVTKLNASQYDAAAISARVDTSLVYTAYALLQKGLPFTEGIKSNIVYDTFTLPNTTGFLNVTFNANVQGFFPKYNCSTTSISPVMEPPGLNHPARLSWNATVNNTTCLDDVYIVIDSLRPETRFSPPRQLKPTLDHINCLNTSENAGIETYRARGLQHILSMADFRFTQVFNTSTVANNLTYGDEVGTESWNIEIKELASVTCSPYYTIQTVGVTYDMSDTPPVITIAEPVAGSETQFDTFFNQDLLDEFDSSLIAADRLFGFAANMEYALEVPHTMFKMMAEAVGGSYEDLLDEKVLAEAAELVFEHIAVQIAKKYLTQPDQSTYKGEAVFAGERLQVRTLSFAIMIAGFGLMAVMVVAVWLTRPFEVAPHNPESIASMAGATAHSGGFQQCLQTCAQSTEHEARHFLKQGQYSSSMHSVFGCSHLEIHHQHNGQQIRSEDLAAELPWWDPLSLRRASVILSLLTPMLVIIALEVVQRISDDNKGFASVHNVSITVTGIYTRFLPALIMLLVATLFNCLDFNSSCLAPFNALRSRRKRGYETITPPLLGQYPPLALWTALRLHYWAAALAAVAAFMGSVLTIVVSGLLTVENVPYESEVSLKRLDRWNTTWTGSSLDDQGAAVLLSLTECANLSYPASTYDELAFPTLGHAQFVSGGNNQRPGLVQVQVPALRGKLDCAILAREHYNFTAARNSEYGYYTTSLDASAPLPSNCLLGGPYANETALEIHSFFQNRGASSAAYFAQIIGLHVGPYDRISGSSSRELDPQQPDNPPGCPSLAFWFGYADAENMVNSRDTVLVCDQQLEQVITNVTLKYPEYSISPNHPPIPDESTAVLLPSGRNNETAFWWRLRSHMEDRFSLFNQSKLVTAEDKATESQIATFFHGVLEGKTPMPLDTLLDSDSTFMGMQKFYRRYMAQAISSNMRINSTTASTSSLRARQTTEGLPSYTATYTPTVGQARLIQHKAPKLALQIMLGVMFICGTLAWTLGDFDKVVPWNPCTIAGVAVLFAGSRMCDPQIQKQQKSWQSLDQNVEDTAARVHEPYDHESSNGATTSGDRTSLPCPNDAGYRDNGENDISSSISTSVGPVINQTQDHCCSGTDKAEDQWAGMRFRLGWWRDESFMGRQGPSSISSSLRKAGVKKAVGREDYREQGAKVDDVNDEMERGRENARWRYGIDIISPKGHQGGGEV